MKHTISQQRQTLDLLEDLLDYFYHVSVCEYDINLQGKFSDTLLKKLELFGADFTLQDGYYRATINRLNTKIKFVIEAEEN